MSRSRATDGGAPADLVPEMALLLAAARLRIRPEAPGHIGRLARGPIDWTRLIELALEHKLALLLRQALNAACPEDVPEDVAAPLEDYAANIATRNRHAAGQLVRLLDALADQGLPAVPFKGPALAVAAYGDVALRTFDDLDLLLRDRDVAPAKRLLASLGFEPSPDLQLDWEWHFESADWGVNLDLHAAVTKPQLPAPRDPEWFWERLAPIAVAGREVPGLSRPDMLITSCLQAVKDWQEQQSTLVRLCDIAGLLAADPALDWDALRAETRRLGVERSLLFGLRLAHDLVAAPVPAGIVAEIDRQRAVAALAAPAAAALRDVRAGPPGIRATTRFQLDIWDGDFDPWPARLRRLAWLLVTPNASDRTLVPLPAGLHFLYYVLRPVRLLATNGGRAAGAFLMLFRRAG